MIRPVGADTTTAPELPQRYAHTVLFQRLRVCERFGMRPGEFDALDVGQQVMLLTYERIREQEEARAES